jgi:hypothetical protein
MTLKDRLLRRSSVGDGDVSDSLALPRFPFETEDDNRPLVSTERLFRQWQEEDTQYDPGNGDAEIGARKEEEIIVSMLLARHSDG